MAERNLQQSGMFTVTPPAARLVCCRCSRAIFGADEQLLPVPVCSRHYMCRSCYVTERGAVRYCPGCLMISSPVADSLSTMNTGWPQTRTLSRLNGTGHVTGATRFADADSNGNGGAMGGGSVSDMCVVCGRQTELQWVHCQSCPEPSDWSQARPVCQSCWQAHQLDAHVLPSLRLHQNSTCTTTTSQQEQHHLDVLAAVSSSALAGDDHQQPVTSSSSSVSIRRPIRQSRALTHSPQHDDQALTAIFGGLMIHPPSAVNSELSALLPVPSGSSGLLTPGLHDASSRHRRLTALQTPVSRQYEGWLWQALNNGGFEQAGRSIDERKQQIGVNLQSTLREMEFRLERCRGVLDELYRECMRQAIEVSRCQMEALQGQSETLQRVRGAAARLQHARLYNDKTRAMSAEVDLVHCLRQNASSTCLRPCDDGWIEFRSPSDDELRAYLRSVCAIDCRVHPPLCSVTCHDRDVNCLSWTVVGRLSEFDIQLRNHCHGGVDDPALTVLISDTRGAELSYEYQRRSAGHFVVRFRPTSTGTHHIYVLLRDRHLADSPYTVGVTEKLCYRLTDCPTPWTLNAVVSLSYNLVKPWGVCWAPATADASDRFLVADRDAHSILVFDRNGSFVARRTSSFRRPTHLAVTSRGHVVITDKDNHRIQVFTSSWGHVRTFGSEGDRDGQFRYPWEVAVNSADEILVSDSKNYRVQLFTGCGQFLAKHCLERASRDDKDGPRGVAFSPTDFAAVADFDMLRVLILSPDLRCVVHVVGVPGLTSSPRSAVDLRTKGCIERPRGLAFDAHGHLLVVQARTNRETNSLIKFATNGDCQLLEFDKDACGMCVCPDNRIAVVHPQSAVVVYSDT